jgi:hypothetical protein
MTEAMFQVLADAGRALRRAAGHAAQANAGEREPPRPWHGGGKRGDGRDAPEGRDGELQGILRNGGMASGARFTRW